MKIARYDRILGCLVCLFAGCAEADPGDAGGVDGCESTDGIDVTNLPLGPTFPQGLFIAHDADNEGANASNFKLVPWQSVADATGLAIVTD